MQTIQQLADNFYTRYEDHSDGFGHSSTVYNKRLCEQVRKLVEYHVTEALKAASEQANMIGETQHNNGAPDVTSDFVYVVDSNGPDYGYVVNKESILESYPLSKIK
jgi:hypothetical protein